MQEFTKNGILYTWYLSGPGGAAFILFPTDKNTSGEIEEAKEQLRRDHDVLSIRIALDADRDHLFKLEVFRVPAISHLQSREIHLPDERIRLERVAGLTPEQYVSKWILPFIG